jgi:tetratricopeptide (TPR) repeat protein
MAETGNQPAGGSLTRESFEERIAILFEELELAIRWDRPSILLAVYESEIVRKEAQAELENRLRGIGHQIHHFQVNEAGYDVPLALSQHPGREETVFYVTGLKWGGGKGGFNAYRMLNLRREVFVDHRIRAVFWLTRVEASHLPRRAPDFWAFRHRVVEFFEQPSPAGAAPAPTELDWGQFEPGEVPEDIEAAISLRETLLASLPQDDAALVSRVDLLHTLARLKAQAGEREKAADLLRQGLGIAERVQDLELQARFWNGLGILALESDDSREALVSLQAAVQRDPASAAAWSNLSVCYSLLEHFEDALQAGQTAIQLAPQNARAWAALGGVFHSLGHLDDALKAIQKATRLDAQKAGYWSKLGAVYQEMGREREARRAFSKAAKLGGSG